MLKKTCRNIFDEINIGESFELTCEKFKLGFENAGFQTIQPKLSFEGAISESVIRRVFIWELPIDFVTGTTSGSGFAFIPNTSSGLETGFVTTESNIRSKAYIKITFDNNNIISKEQQGI